MKHTQSTHSDNTLVALYGAHTCVLQQVTFENYIYEMRLLDNVGKQKAVHKSVFYELIPELLTRKYTVVIVEFRTTHGTLEVSTVHLPVQSQLHIPPIIQ